MASESPQLVGAAAPKTTVMESRRTTRPVRTASGRPRRRTGERELAATTHPGGEAETTRHPAGPFLSVKPTEKTGERPSAISTLPRSAAGPTGTRSIATAWGCRRRREGGTLVAAWASCVVREGVAPGRRGGRRR